VRTTKVITQSVINGCRLVYTQKKLEHTFNGLYYVY